MRCIVDLLALLRRVVARVELPRVLAVVRAVLGCGSCLCGHLQLADLALGEAAVVARDGTLLLRLLLLRLGLVLLGLLEVWVQTG